MARYRWEYSSGSEAKRASFPSGTVHFSSSNTKWQLPITTRFSPMVVEIPWATIYSTFECISWWSSFFFFAASTTARAMEWGKCSSRQAAMRSSSSGVSPLKEMTEATVGQALVSVPVLSKTMVSASATASRYFPPFTVTWCRPASRMADSTEMGMASFSAQEKSTIRTASAFVTFRVRSHTRIVPMRVQGTRLSARCSAFPSSEDFSFSDSSIMVTIFSNLLEPPTAFTRTVSSPSSTTVPA